MLSYGFMQRAFVIGLVLGALLPCMGLIMVLRRESMIGDALAHSSLAGVALGLLLGFDPLIGSVAACVIAALSLDRFRLKMGRYSEMAMAMVMSAGIGLASILSDFVRTPANFNAYLFGSIVAVSETEAKLTVILSLAVLFFYFRHLNELFLISYSRRSAQLCGVPVQRTEFLFTLMTALTISLASRTVGALIVSSFMVIPAACALLLGKSFRSTLVYSIVFSELFMVLGLMLSFHFDLKPGGSFVMVALAAYLLLSLFSKKESSSVH